MRVMWESNCNNTNKSIIELVRSLDCSKPQLCALWKRGGGGVTYLWKYLHCVLSFKMVMHTGMLLNHMV